MHRRALLVVNTNSRKGAEILETAIAELAGLGVEPRHIHCGSREDLSPLIIAHGHGMDLVVVGGGDGTLGAAARGILETGLPMGIIPSGTANDLARTLDIPLETRQAVAVIAAGNIRRVDIGCVNDQYFFNVASIGMSAELALELTGDIKRRFGKLGYALAALRVLARARPFQVRIEHAGRQIRTTTLQVAVGNGKFYGGGNVIEKSAAIDDGRLDLYSLEFLRAWRLIFMLRSFRNGDHSAWKEVRSLRGTEFSIRTRRPRAVNADGEIVSSTPATFRILPGAIGILAPRPE